MLFSVNWLKKWVDIDMPAQELAGKLTASGLEVDTVKPVAAHFSDIVVAEILSCDAHPDADKSVQRLVMISKSTRPNCAGLNPSAWPVQPANWVCRMTIPV